MQKLTQPHVVYRTGRNGRESGQSAPTALSHWNDRVGCDRHLHMHSCSRYGVMGDRAFPRHRGKRGFRDEVSD